MLRSGACCWAAKMWTILKLRKERMVRNVGQRWIGFRLDSIELVVWGWLESMDTVFERYYCHCLGLEREFNDHQHKPSASKLNLKQYLIKNQDHVNDAYVANPIAAVYALNILSRLVPFWQQNVVNLVVHHYKWRWYLGCAIKTYGNKCI